MLERLAMLFSQPTYFVTATVATLLLLAGLVLDGCWGRRAAGLRQGPVLAGVLASIATGAWLGLAVLQSREFHEIAALRTAIAGTLATSLALALVERWRRRPLAARLPTDLVGDRGQVYRRLGPGGGVVRITRAGRTWLLPATTDGPDLPAFTDVVVLEVRDGGVRVKPWTPQPGATPDAAGPSSGTPRADRPGA